MKHSEQQWEVKEKPFTSSVPLIGPLIVLFRNTWNSVATKWYVRRILEQQNDFNRLFAELIANYHAQVTDEDRENSEITHEIAELSTQIAQLNRTLRSLDKRLARLEKGQEVKGSKRAG